VFVGLWDVGSESLRQMRQRSGMMGSVLELPMLMEKAVA
jgi:hypothetical protein